MTQANTQSKTKNFDELFNELAAQTEVLESTDNPEVLLMANLKILGLARKFAEIDEMILNFSDDKYFSGNYFSQILTYETLRLRFKEEISKCTDKNKIQTL